VPVSLREEYRRQYESKTDDGAVVLKLPHYAVYRLLAELKDDLATRYFAREHDTKAVLDQRNLSILAHGDRAVGEKVYQRLLPLVCHIVDVSVDDLPRFPVLPE
jgi:hypothetical protein